MGNPPVHRARKRFGQNFLHDRSVIDRIISCINPVSGDSIVEIGPGQGALTFPLLQKCGSLTAIELDRDLIAPLQDQSKKYGDLTLINADILKISFSDLEIKAPIRVTGNLPYNISTPLMFHLLEQETGIKDMHFMLQKEVAERIVAKPDNKQYGRLSVMMQYHAECEYLFTVKPSSFKPAPKVDSAIVRLKPWQRKPHLAENYTVFFQSGTNSIQSAT